MNPTGDLIKVSNFYVGVNGMMEVPAVWTFGLSRCLYIKAGPLNRLPHPA